MLSKCVNGLKSKHTAILGAQWGDEGKGKLVDILAEKYDICARFNGFSQINLYNVYNNYPYPITISLPNFQLCY